MVMQTVKDSKTTSGVRTVFVPRGTSDELRAHVDQEGLSGTDRRFTIQRRTVQSEHKRACKLVGITGYTIHDHRHTAAVHLARAGMPLDLLQRQLGRKHITMTMRYAEFHPDYSDVAVYFDRVEQAFGFGVPVPSLAHTSDEAVAEVAPEVV
jgi:integrase